MSDGGGEPAATVSAADGELAADEGLVGEAALELSDAVGDGDDDTVTVAVGAEVDVTVTVGVAVEGAGAGVLAPAVSVVVADRDGEGAVCGDDWEADGDLLGADAVGRATDGDWLSALDIDAEADERKSDAMLDRALPADPSPTLPPHPASARAPTAMAAVHRSRACLLLTYPPQSRGRLAGSEATSSPAIMLLCAPPLPRR